MDSKDIILDQVDYLISKQKTFRCYEHLRTTLARDFSKNPTQSQFKEYIIILMLMMMKNYKELKSDPEFNRIKNDCGKSESFLLLHDIYEAVNEYKDTDYKQGLFYRVLFKFELLFPNPTKRLQCHRT